MIKLKDLLTAMMYSGQLDHAQWYPAHTRHALEWTLVGDYVPLAPRQMESLYGKVPVSAYHVTNATNIKSVKNILGKKKPISTFTKANKTSKLAKGRGVQTHGGGVIFYVEGLMLARNYQDFDTVPDRSGRRWVKGYHLFNDSELVRNAAKRAKLPGYEEWRGIENRVSDKVEKKFKKKNPDAGWRDRQKEIIKAMKPIAANQIKSYISMTNGLLKKYKDVIHDNLRQASDEVSAWWNEILVYNTKIIDCFVLKRTWDDYYFQKDSGYGDHTQISYKKQLLDIVPESKITVGTPAQFRKWYTSRDGEITISK